MIKQIEITLPAYSRGFHLITDEVTKSLGELPETGILHLLYQAHLSGYYHQRK